MPRPPLHPSGRGTIISVYLPPAILRLIRETAAAHNLSFSSALVRLLEIAGGLNGRQ
jgi:hypothetical protein